MYKNKEDQKEYARKHYLKNKDKVKARAANFTKQHRLKVKAYLQDMKSKTPCTDCKKHYHFSAMDFDHISGAKRYNLGDSSLHSNSWEKVFEELAKCELVCANCHRLRTYNRMTRSV